MTMRGIQKLAEINSLLAGGAAGIGAYALTDALTRNAVQAKRLAMTQAIGDYAKTRSAPLVAGAVTALIIGALVASRMKDKAQQPVVSPQRVTYQRQGFYPGEIVPFPVGHTVY